MSCGLGRPLTRGLVVWSLALQSACWSVLGQDTKPPNCPWRLCWHCVIDCDRKSFLHWKCKCACAVSSLIGQEGWKSSTYRVLSLEVWIQTFLFALPLFQISVPLLSHSSLISFIPINLEVCCIHNWRVVNGCSVVWVLPLSWQRLSLQTERKWICSLWHEPMICARVWYTRVK